MTLRRGQRLSDVHMFWHGPWLSRVERLCLTSFLACGHRVLLYVYEAPSGVPDGVQLRDARELIPRDQLYVHSQTGSLALFADYFRFRVLQAHGGIYADTDVVCLKPLTYAQDEIYGWQNSDLINVAILGLPPGHPLASWMARVCEEPNRFLPYDDARARLRKLRRRWLQGNQRGNVRWGEVGPYGFTDAARHFGQTQRALPVDEFYAVPFEEWQRVFSGEPTDWSAVLSHSTALHLWNEMMRRDPAFDKDGRFPSHSLFEQLCQRWLPEDSQHVSTMPILPTKPAVHAVAAAALDGAE
jgi:hypothetical protein